VNWHPAPLAHEVIGNQVAYYHMAMMEKALSQVIAGEDKLDLEGVAAVLPLPTASACKEEVCTFLGEAKPKCAYSYLPKAEGPDVGDWMVNSTDEGEASKWTNQPTADGCKENTDRCKSETDSGNDPEKVEACYRAAKQCSYLDQKRGFAGNADSGAISFKVPEMYHCKVWLGEPGYEWAKPKHMANWDLELEVKVNGELCEAPKCKVARSGYLQTLVVDARAIMGGKCRRQDVVISLEIKPVEDDKIECNVKCEPSGKWSGYHASLCTSHECAKKDGTKPHGVQKFAPRYSSKSEIRTFVSEIIAF